MARRNKIDFRILGKYGVQNICIPIAVYYYHGDTEQKYILEYWVYTECIIYTYLGITVYYSHSDMKQKWILEY